MNNVLQLLDKRGAVILNRHFVYKSGTHGPHYINMDPVFTSSKTVALLGYELARPFWDAEVDTVVAAATGGIPLAYAVANELSADAINRQLKDCKVAWADKKGNGFVFGRSGFTTVLKDRNVLVVEDLLNQGSTVNAVVAEARRHGATVVGVSVVCNRGSQTTESLGVPVLEQLGSVNFEAFPANDCPLCASRVPIVNDIGHGETYESVNPEYAGGYVSLLS